MEKYKTQVYSFIFKSGFYHKKNLKIIFTYELTLKYQYYLLYQCFYFLNVILKYKILIKLLT